MSSSNTDRSTTGTQGSPEPPRKLAERAWLDYGVKRSDGIGNETAQKIARQVVGGRAAPDMQLLEHLDLEIKDMQTALKTTCEETLSVFSQVIKRGSDPQRLEAFNAMEKLVKWTQQGPGVPEVDHNPDQHTMLGRYFEGMQHAALAYGWSRDLRDGVIPPQPLLSEKEQEEERRYKKISSFAEKQYGIRPDQLYMNEDSERWILKIASCVIEDGKKPPDLELLRIVKPDPKDLLVAFARVRKFIFQCSAQISKDILKPPEWLETRLLEITDAWCEEVEASTMLKDVATHGQELTFVAGCFGDAAECSRYRRAQRQGVWIARPKEVKEDSPEPWEDPEAGSDDETWFGPSGK